MSFLSVIMRFFSALSPSKSACKPLDPGGLVSHLQQNPRAYRAILKGYSGLQFDYLYRIPLAEILNRNKQPLRHLAELAFAVIVGGLPGL